MTPSRSKGTRTFVELKCPEPEGKRATHEERGTNKGQTVFRPADHRVGVDITLYVCAARRTARYRRIRR